MAASCRLYNVVRFCSVNATYKLYGSKFSYRTFLGSQSIVPVRSFLSGKNSKAPNSFGTGSTGISFGKKLLFSSFGGMLAITLYLWNGKRTSVNAEQGVRPKHTPIRRIKNESDNTGLKLTLYQFQTCPFCCKVRAYLDYYGLSYDVVEVNSVWRTELKWTKYPKVPVLVCDGIGSEGYVQINDSSVIISVLQSLIEDRTYTASEGKGLDTFLSYYPSIESKGKRGKTVYEYPNKYFIMVGDRPELPSTTKQKSEERKWRTWVDSWLVHTLSPNVYRTPGEALQAFNYFSEVGEWNKVFNPAERTLIIYVGAVAMYILGKVLKKRHSLKSDVRLSLYDACDEWVKAIGPNRQFMGGSQPNLADLSVYGVLSSIEGCSAFQDLLNNSEIRTWFYNTKKLVTSHSGVNFK